MGVGSFQLCEGNEGRRSRSLTCPKDTVSSVPPLLPSTQIQVVSSTNQPLARTSCGTEGFRNAKKGTGIAAQTAGIAAAAVSASPAPSGSCALPAWPIAEESLQTHPAEAVGCLPAEHCRG